jgi:hypothetical protein
MERRREGKGAYGLHMYRHIREIGYQVPCPSIAHHLDHPIACSVCRDRGFVGFFRAERIRREQQEGHGR